MLDPEWQSRLKVQHLLVLANVGRYRNAHRTAQEMGLSQPAISKIIREVEEIFAVQLFERGRAGMHPNGVGEALIARAVALLNDLAHTRAEIAAVTAGEVGHLRVGVIAFLPPTLISRTLRRFAEARLSLTLDIHEGTTQPLVAQLMRRELDCVIGRYVSEREHELDQQVLYYQRFVAVVSGTHPRLGGTQAVSLADTEGCGWIVPPSRTAARQALSALFMQSGLAPPRVQVESASLEIIKASLLDSDLVGILPTDIAQHFMEGASLRVLPFKIDYRPAPVTLIRRRGEQPAPAVERFSQAVIEVAAALEG